MYLVASKIIQGGVSLFLIKVFQMLVVFFSFTGVMNCEPTERFPSDSRGPWFEQYIQFTIKTDSEACVIISDITSYMYLVFDEMHCFIKTSTIFHFLTIFPWK